MIVERSFYSRYQYFSHLRDLTKTYLNHLVDVEHEWCLTKIGLDMLARFLDADAWIELVAFNISKCGA